MTSTNQSDRGVGCCIIILYLCTAQIGPMVSPSSSFNFKGPLASDLDIPLFMYCPSPLLGFWQRLSPLVLCEEGLCSFSLSLSMSLSLFLPLWGEAVNNAGGLADLCEPEALWKAGVPRGDRQKEGSDECAEWRAVPYRSPRCLENRG